MSSMAVFKPEYTMNGFPGGYYNLDITEFVATDEWLEAHGVEPGTSYVDYLLSFNENRLAYDRRFHLEQLEMARAKELEKARNTDVGSAGLAASHINNRASKDKVTQPEAKVNPESLTPGEEDAIVEGKRDKNLSAIVDEIQKTLPKTEAEIAAEQVEQADRDLEAVQYSVREDMTEEERYRANPHFEGAYVLLGAFQDNEHIIPVKLEIKKESGETGNLYVVVAMTKIERTSVMGSEVPYSSESDQPLPVTGSIYSLQQIVSKINTQDADFLKYIPDRMLSGEQIIAKENAKSVEKAKLDNVMRIRWVNTGDYKVIGTYEAIDSVSWIKDGGQVKPYRAAIQTGEGVKIHAPYVFVQGEWKALN